MSKTSGKIEIKIIGQGITVQIIKLFPYIDEETPVTTDHILKLLAQNKVNYGIDKQVINYFVEKCLKEENTLNDIVIASSKLPAKAGVPVVKFNKSPYTFDNVSIWSMIDRMLKDESLDISKIPYPLVYHKKDDVIASLLPSSDNQNGKNVFGEDIASARFNLGEFYAGENVRYDDGKKVFIAGVSGYLCVKDTTLSIVSPFKVSSDKMSLYYYKYKSDTNDYPGIDDIKAYLNKNKISERFLLNTDLSSVSNGTVALIAKGLVPEESTDAKILYHYEVAEKGSKLDENGQINFREIQSFTDVKENQVIATKIQPVKGRNGEDLFGGVIPSRNPRDLGIKCGLNTFKEENDEEIKIISATEGIVDNKNGIISVFPQLRFPGDIDYETGNIHTKVNVHINGTVCTGFTVQSEKNIFINGSIEDNCLIEAGGDIYVQNGATGQNTKLIAGGNLSIKFIEGSKFNVKGNVNVQRFLLGAEGECGDTMVIMGSGVNLNERGAIVDCDLKIKNSLIVPTIGNEAGTKSKIEFGYDGVMHGRIVNLTEAVEKLKAQINEINDKFEVDITSPNIHVIIKNFAKSVKDDIITAIQEKNKLESKMNMMQGMLDKELESKRAILEKANLQFTKKVFPTLHLECDGAVKVIDTLQPPSKFYLDLETHWIERTRY